MMAMIIGDDRPNGARVRHAHQLSPSLIALAAALLATPAAAQNAFQGAPTTQSGSVAYGGSAGTDIINVASEQAVINWAPNDTAIGGGVIDFLPVGTTATFVNDPTLGNNFTVLNRILPADPSRAVGLNGTIQARFEDMSTGVRTPGGGIWFYSPGGLVIGSTAAIDVGRLTLTTADPLVDGSGNFITGGLTQFQVANSASSIRIEPGASIIATPENSYVVAVAPYIFQGGSVNVNGSAAYVAAEAATLTINGGLFDIQITQGTDGNGAGQALLHTGTTTGPASSGAGDSHRIYMVAVPKNVAITALVASSGGSLGFDIAGAADVVGNAVVLSAGQNVSDTLFTQNATSTNNATVTVQDTSVTSRLYGRATTEFDVLSGIAGINYAAPVSLSSGVLTQVQAVTAGAAMQFDAGLDISASSTGGANGGNATGGTAYVAATGVGSTVAVNGDLVASADGIGGDNLSGSGSTGNGTGGRSLVAAVAGGTVAVSGDVIMSAAGRGGVNGTTGVAGGNGTGGIGQILVDLNNATIAVGGDIAIDAGGYGANGFGCISCLQDGGTGTGGTISINGGVGGIGETLTVTGAITQIATGVGGSGLTARAGDGIGGTTALLAGNGGVTTVGGDVLLDARGVSGDYVGTSGNGNGPNATGGGARIGSFTQTGTLSIGGNATALAGATGGALQGGTPGVAQGGTAAITAGAGSMAIAGDASTSSFASGSNNNGGSGGRAIGGISLVGTGPDAFLAGGGNAALTIGGNAIADSRALGGQANGTAVNGGNATGGFARLHARDGSIAVGGGGDVRAGAMGGSVTGGGNGGNALSGYATMLADNGTLTFNGTVPTGQPTFPAAGAYVSVVALGGTGAGGGNGGTATAQTAVVNGGELGAQIVALSSNFGPASITAPSVLMIAGSTGGRGGDGTTGGAGGEGISGVALLLGSAGNGTIDVGTTILQASGIGGAGGNGTVQGGRGGSGTGGNVQYGVQSGAATASTAGSATIGNVTVQTLGIGGNGGSGGATGLGGNGGSGLGGGNILIGRGTPVTVGDVNARSDGRGGNGGSGTSAGAGGNGLSGSTNILMTQRAQTADRGLLTAGTFAGFASGIGGTGQVNGLGGMFDSSAIFIRQSDASFTGINLQAAAANGNAPGAIEAIVHVESGSLDVANALNLVTGGNLSVLVENGSVTAGSVGLSALDFIADTATPNPVAPGLIDAGSINLQSGGDVIVSANFNSPDSVDIANNGDVRVGNLTSGSFISISALGSIQTGALVSGDEILLENDSGNISFVSATAASDIDFDAAGNVTGGPVTSGDSITALAGGQIVLGALSAGLVNPSMASDAAYSIGVAAIGNVQVASASAAVNVGLGSDAGSVSSGNIAAGSSVLVLAGDDIVTGDVLAGTAATDYVYFADSSLFSLGGTIDDFDPAPIFATTPVRSGGSIAVNGTVTAGHFLTASQGGLGVSGNAAASQRIVLDSGANAAFGGQVSAPTIRIASDNLSLGANGRLGIQSTASLSLISNNSGGLVLGGVAQPTSGTYQIDGQEAQNLRAQAISMTASAVEIRDVALLGSAAGSGANLAGSGGSLSISSSRNIAVTGNFAVDQMADGNNVSLTGARVSVATDQGSILLSGNSPGGILNIDADDIHVAHQSILDRLASDVNFAGRDALLGIGTGSGMPTLQAREINLTARRSILIQNNGSSTRFAGFNSYLGGVNIDPAGISPGGGAVPLDLVIYGSQIDPDTGALFNDQSLRDAVIDPLRASEFTLNSSVNGCLLSSSACVVFGNEETGSITNNIRNRDENEEEKEQKGKEEAEEVIFAKAESMSPIQPPVTIIDSRPVAEQPLLDDPVTGAGNQPPFEPASGSGASEEVQP